jgi:hypothetical protein
MEPTKPALPSTPRPNIPAELDKLVGLLPRYDTVLPNSAILLKEKEKALIMKHLHPMLVDVDPERLRNIHEELLKCETEHSPKIWYVYRNFNNGARTFVIIRTVRARIH